ncbi:conserved hypothetical protein [Thermus thermophilus HB8]|uniref:Putative restriction endonuclease domain-containing protein n=1 Tax=Thermus thermophilus (strain ATCC 27634 / DSM 579 / HB8) TaxID=300852 RepID=Q5SIZ0_THET8|nr:conserved hypothetical protein [Thermus thermophilus HB8]
MGAAKQVRPLTLEEYLALEREAPVKHELVEGFPHAMAGTGDRHNRVVVNLVLALGPLARKRGCRLYASDMRLKVDAATVYYPDLMLRRRPRGILQGKGLPGDRGALALHGGHGPEGKALQVPGSAHPPSLPPPGLPHPPGLRLLPRRRGLGVPGGRGRHASPPLPRGAPGPRRGVPGPLEGYPLVEGRNGKASLEASHLHLPFPLPQAVEPALPLAEVALHPPLPGVHQEVSL